jgi:CRISPR-associated protein Cas2
MTVLVLKRWFVEPKPNVFVGTVNRRTRDKVLDYVKRNA